VDGEYYVVKCAITQFYVNLYQEETISTFLDGINYDSISLDDAFELDGKDKAPDPDGFNIAFFQPSWSNIKGEIMRLLPDFHRTDIFDKTLNATFISLIPKVAGADDMKKFRPINLVRSVYKILAKALALRVRKVIGKIVGPLSACLRSRSSNFRCIFDRYIFDS